MTTLAILHTTPATIEPLKALAAELLPGYSLLNWMDDSILPQLARNGNNVAEVEERLVQYARYAEQAKADAILFACSSVGEVASRARQVVSVPVLRIDEPMAKLAVQRGKRLGVAATLSTTLDPTLRLLRDQAAAANKHVILEPCLVESAYQKLMAGDKDGHDLALAGALADLAATADVVVLAQASMARVLPGLPHSLQDRFLSSPRLGLESVRQALAESND